MNKNCLGTWTLWILKMKRSCACWENLPEVLFGYCPFGTLSGPYTLKQSIFRSLKERLVISIGKKILRGGALRGCFFASYLYHEILNQILIWLRKVMDKGNIWWYCWYPNTLCICKYLQQGNLSCFMIHDYRMTISPWVSRNSCTRWVPGSWSHTSKCLLLIGQYCLKG